MDEHQQQQVVCALMPRPELGEDIPSDAYLAIIAPITFTFAITATPY